MIEIKKPNPREYNNSIYLEGTLMRNPSIDRNFKRVSFVITVTTYKTNKANREYPVQETFLITFFGDHFIEYLSPIKTGKRVRLEGTVQSAYSIKNRVSVLGRAVEIVPNGLQKTIIDLKKLDKQFEDKINE